MNPGKRSRIIKDLEIFLEHKKQILATVFETLGWDENKLLADEEKRVCPHDGHHWVPQTSFEKHVELCSWIKEGYTKDDMIKQPPDSSKIYEGSSMVPVLIDRKTQADILVEKGCLSSDKRDSGDVPMLAKTVDREPLHLSTEQRLAIYDYVIEQSGKTNKPSSLNLEDLSFDFEKKNQEDKPKSYLEEMAAKRDYRRRRQTYRGKNVHTSNKSYTEVMREVIENQTAYLTENSKEEHKRRSSSPSENESTYSHRDRTRHDYHFERRRYDDDTPKRKYREDEEYDDHRPDSRHKKRQKRRRSRSDSSSRSPPSRRHRSKSNDESEVEISSPKRHKHKKSKKHKKHKKSRD